MKRYYLKHTGGIASYDAKGNIDSGPRSVYRLDVARDAVRRGGGKQIRTAHQDGDKSQPRVVTWNCANWQIRVSVAAELMRIYPFVKQGFGLPTVLEKDWR